MRSKPQEPLAPPASQGGCLGLLVRLVWMFFGNAALVLIAVHIAQRGSFSALDGVFWGVVVAMIGLRFLDVTRLGGLTAEGAPASMRDWQRYAAYTLVAALLLYGLAHGVARL